MPLLRITLGIIFRVNIRPGYAGCGSRVVRRRLPRSVQQFHVPEFVERDAAPVIRRSRRFQAGFALSAVLIAEHAELPLSVPSQPVRTKQAVVITVDSRDRPSVLHCRTQGPVNIGHRASSARSHSATHTFRLLRAGINLKTSIVYNTVVLA